MVAATDARGFLTHLRTTDRPRRVTGNPQPLSSKTSRKHKNTLSMDLWPAEPLVRDEWPVESSSSVGPCESCGRTASYKGLPNRVPAPRSFARIDTVMGREGVAPGASGA